MKIENDFKLTNVDEIKYKQYRQCIHFQNNPRLREYSTEEKNALKDIFGTSDENEIQDIMEQQKEDEMTMVPK